MSTAFRAANAETEARVIDRVIALVSELTGNQFGDRQRTMVITRLRNRMLKLGLKSFDEYEVYFSKNQEEEKNALISLLTTHHTFFFREFSHFEYLAQEGLAKILPQVLARPEKTLRIWSAACSGGHEVYTIALFLEYTLKQMGAKVQYSILGTDIDPESVKKAENGVYHANEVKEIPLVYLADHWVRGTGDISDYFKIRSGIRKNCRFETKNLLNLAKEGPKDKFDLIFCRNVFIYFNDTQISEITTQFKNHMMPESLLIVGKSESLKGKNLPIFACAPSIYSFKSNDSTKSSSAPSPKVLEFKKAANASLPNPIKVFSVDDSGVVLSLMKQVFSSSGFEFIGSAINGKDAAEKLKTLKPDVMTLDIHMPEMDGLQYLKAYYNDQHPPVIMVTSVSRESGHLALDAIKSGASDYVEKPALANLSERTEELRAKAKAVVMNKISGHLSQGKDWIKPTSKVNLSDRVLVGVGSLGDRKKINEWLKSMPSQFPPTLIVVEGGGEAVESMSSLFSSPFGSVEAFNPSAPLKANKVYVADFKSSWDKIRTLMTPQKSALNIFGRPSENVRRHLSLVSGAFIALEEILGTSTHDWDPFIKEYVPATSFQYLNFEYFEKGKI